LYRLSKFSEQLTLEKNIYKNYLIKAGRQKTLPTKFLNTYNNSKVSLAISKIKPCSKSLISSLVVLPDTPITQSNRSNDSIFLRNIAFSFHPREICSILKLIFICHVKFREVVGLLNEEKKEFLPNFDITH